MAGRRFMIVLVTGLALMLGGVITSIALADPTGLLVGAGWHQGLCAPGIKDRGDIDRLRAVAQARRPTEIIVGSSRVIHGIDRDALGPSDTSRFANLGLSSATVIDIDRTVRAAVVVAPVKQVWIGLDLSAFGLLDPASSLSTEFAPTLSPRMMSLYNGLLSPSAWSSALRVLRSPRTCRQPPFDLDGFAREAAPGLDTGKRARLPNPTVRAQTISNWHYGAADREKLYAREKARFTRLLADLKHQDIVVVLFVGPTHPTYDNMVEEAGLSAFRTRWRADLEHIAREQGAVLVAADRADFLTSLPDLPLGCETAPVDCAFYDATHFRPVVGEAIIGEGRRLARENVVPSRH